MIDLPLTDTSIVSGNINERFAYTFKGVGDTDLDEGAYPKYDFSISGVNKGDKYDFKNILGVWIIEKSNDRTKLSVPIKSNVIDGRGSAGIFLIKDYYKILVDSGIYNYTNAPFLLLRGEEYLVYANADKLILYSIKEKRSEIIAVLKINPEFQYQNCKLNISVKDETKLNIFLTVKNIDENRYYLTSFDLPVKSIPQ